MEELRRLIITQRVSQSNILHRFKERKAKIRKFMLFVNNALNETEKEFEAAYHLFRELELAVTETSSLNTEQTENILSGKGKSKTQLSEAPLKHKKQSTTPKLQPKGDDFHEMLVAETVPADISTSSFSGSSTERLLIPETCMPDMPLDELKGLVTGSARTFDNLDLNTKTEEHEALKDGDYQNQPKRDSMDETIGINASQNESFSTIKAKGFQSKLLPNEDGAIISEGSTMKPNCSQTLVEIEKHKKGSKPKIEHHTSDELLRMESGMLSPVSNFLDDVLSSVKGKPHVHGNNIGKKKLHCSKQLESVKSTSTETPPPPPPPKSQAADNGSIQVEYAKSPSIFSDEEILQEDKQLLVDSHDDDVTALSQVCTPVDIIVTKMKKKSLWPIKYPKPVIARGELVVEPASEHQKYRKRPRQTRLDGYLSKTKSANQNKRILNLSGRASHLLPSPYEYPKSSLGQTKSDPSIHKDSDSEEDLKAMDLDVLDGPKGFQASILTTSTQKLEQSTLLDDTFITEHDRLPEKKQKVQYGEVVRGKARKDLNGYQCKQCYQYYSSLKLSEDEIQKRLNEVCRHRAQKPPMETPPQFWNMSFASNLDSTPPSQ